jgi:hypothetical protein
MSGRFARRTAIAIAIGSAARLHADGALAASIEPVVFTRASTGE